jgi:hypothetical protein
MLGLDSGRRAAAQRERLDDQFEPSNVYGLVPHMVVMRRKRLRDSMKEILFASRSGHNRDINEYSTH